MERPIFAERRASFNPEAVAFSPRMDAGNLLRDRSALMFPTAPPTMSLAGLSAVSSPESAVRLQEKVRQPINEQSHTEPLWLQNLLSVDSSQEFLTPGSGAERPTTSFQATYGTLSQVQLLSQDTRDVLGSQSLGLHTPLFRTEPYALSPDVSELAASFGLPGPRNNIMVESPVRSNEARGPQGVPSGRAGKLLGRALGTALTADTLAQYLANRSDTSEDTIRPSLEARNPVEGQDQKIKERPQTSHLVHPPPGYVQEPRIVTEDNSERARITATQQIGVPIVPAGYFKQYHPTPQPVAPLQHQTRQSLGRRQTRRHTRTKRTDQGPEPSAADIYPDDANWAPPRANHYNGLAPIPSLQISSKPELHVEDPMSWPTPAEVYTQKPRVQQVTDVCQSISVFDNHVSSTHEDVNAADADVIASINELPNLSMGTLSCFEPLDLLPDDRPLTPGQENGSIYGISFSGISLGDGWICPAFSDGRSWENPAPFGN